VLTALMLAGRVGASIAAEIGTMKVTEQIEALRALGVHPIDYLIVPRVLALIISGPLLAAECIGLGIGAGYLVATKVLGISEAYYVTNMLKFTTERDLKMAMIKGVCFAVLIGFIACAEGLKTSQGAVGVGRAPTQAVVIASLVILISNFFLSFALNIFFPAGTY
jgi:phospholipid/cholesterol/gamma-HCH transport system permease protein